MQRQQNSGVSALHMGAPVQKNPFAYRHQCRRSRSGLCVHAFLKLGGGSQQAPAAPSLRVTLNTASLVRRSGLELDDEPVQQRDAQQQAPQQLLATVGGPKQVSDASLSSATVRARRKVERVVLQNLRQQRSAHTSAQQQLLQQQTKVAGTGANATQQPPPTAVTPGAAAAAPPTAAAMPANGSDIIMELVLEGNAVADFAGVLTLLLECGGHEEQVIATGSMFLNARDSAATKQRAQQPGLQDVVLCVVLAHAQLAARSMGADTSTPSTSFPHLPRPAKDARPGQLPSAAALEDSYGHINEALRLLAVHGTEGSSLEVAAGPLRQQLLDMLLRVAPLHVGHLLGALPADGRAGKTAPSNSKQRSQAVEVAKTALWQLEGPAQRLELLGQVRPWLTAAEQIALFDDAPVPEAQWAEQELYDTALACIWQGYTQRWPHHVYRADALLGIIAQRQDLGVDVTLERNVCALLLGKRSETQGQLVVAQGAAGATFGGSVTSDGDDIPDSIAAAAVKAVGAGASGEKVAGGGKGGRGVGQQKGKVAGGASGKATAQGSKRSGGHECLQLGAEDSAFVVMESFDNSQEEGSALEHWAERWLEMSVMPLFRSQQVSTPAAATGTPSPSPSSAAAGAPGAAPSSASAAGDGQAVSVRSYLGSPKVAVFNQVLRYANEQNLRHVTENLQHLSHDSLQQLLGLWRSGTSSLAQTVMRSPPKDSPPKDAQQGGQQKGQPAAAQARQQGAGQTHAAGAARARDSVTPGLAVPTAVGYGLSPGSKGAKPEAGADTTVALGTANSAAGVLASAAVAAAPDGVVVDVAAEAAAASAPAPLPPLTSTSGAEEDSDIDWQPVSGATDSGEGVGERSTDGEDSGGLEAVPWVQMAAEHEPHASHIERRTARLAEAGDAGGAADDSAWLSDTDQEMTSKGLGGDAALWVLSSKGVIRPRISARIVDPTHGRTTVPAAAAVRARGVRGAYARAVGITAVVVAMAAGAAAVALGARTTGAGSNAPRGAAEAVVVQQQARSPAGAHRAQDKERHRSWWRFWRRQAKSVAVAEAPNASHGSTATPAATAAKL